jgi:hypothetical protein
MCTEPARKDASAGDVVAIVESLDDLVAHVPESARQAGLPPTPEYGSLHGIVVNLPLPDACTEATLHLFDHLVGAGE